LAGVRVRLTDDRGAQIVFTTNATGEFRLPLFANRTYAGVVTAAGYADRPIGSSSPILLRTLMPIALAPLPVQVQGSVLVDGSSVPGHPVTIDRKSTRLNSSHVSISYAVFCLKKKIYSHFLL